MSRCALVPFGEDGNPLEHASFSNAWGGAARIWTSLYQRYVAANGSWHVGSNQQRLWRLATDPRLLPFERDVLKATFDDVVVQRASFPRLAEALRRFAAEHPSAGADHVPAWADFFATATCRAVGFYHTSVDPDPWGPVPRRCPTCGCEQEDDYEPYNLDVHGKNTWDPFDEREDQSPAGGAR